MWTVEHRLAADRRGLRYPSGMTDTELGADLAHDPPAKHGGRKHSVDALSFNEDGVRLSA